MLAIVSILIGLAHAGVISGGGGGSFVCRDANKNVVSSELLDFWEAREINGLALLRDDAKSVDDQFAVANARLATISSTLAEQTQANYAFIKKNVVKRGPKVRIPPPTDANNKVTDAQCPLEGMMFFDDDRHKLVIKEDSFAKLSSNTETAGAYFHEALYKTMRDNRLEGGKDSVLTRIIVGCLFSEGDLGECLGLSKIAAPTDRKVWQCEIPADGEEPGFSFLAYKEKSSDSDWIVVPSRLGRATFGFQLVGVLSKMPVTLPGMGGGPPGTGTFKFEADSFRIPGIERLGLPWAAKSPPYSSEFLTITATNPFTIQPDNSDSEFTCR